MSATETTYDAAAIETLEGLEAVRKRPGMYIGGTGSAGLMHLVWELIDNAVDEAAAGHATKVEVILHRNKSVEVRDNGRGIPIDRHAKRKVSALEVVFTELHAGGKFGGGAYSASGGLHGVGASVVNALATRLTVEVDRDGATHVLSFKERVAGQFNGASMSDFEKGHQLRTTKRISKNKTGTRVRFWPDYEIFKEQAEVDYEEVCDRLTQACFLVPTMRVSVIDKRPGATNEEFTFQSRGGLADLVEHLSVGEAVSGVISGNGTGNFVEKVPVNKKMTEVTRECVVDLALRWVDGYNTKVVSFVNTIPTSAGGTHLAGFDKALTRVVNNVLLNGHHKLAKLAKNNQHKAAKDDVQEGLVAALKVTFPEPQFRGQTKQELGTPAIDGIVSRVVYEQLKEWFEPGGGPRTHVKAIADKLANAVQNRVASKTLLENQRKAASLGTTPMPQKLADCRVHNQDSELILVEGDSAAGPAKRGRNSETMAILPLRGKVVNAHKASDKQVLDNAEARALFTAMGAGAGSKFNLDDVRYGRIVILCDADVDGSHIRCLLLTLIYKYMRPMLEAGRVFAAQPPLFTTKVGEVIYRVYSEEEKEALTARLCKGNRRPENVKWQRFKGLGEMNVEELRHCALDPATRTLRRLTMKDGAQAAAATEMFEVLMGTDVSSRRDFLVRNSALVDRATLDI
ncbi:MAG: ATP-binding protein [Acidimicrobiaceae bacterium]|nr:ATP-binding protein [Acidimicrobiaceae bacterium]